MKFFFVRALSLNMIKTQPVSSTNSVLVLLGFKSALILSHPNVKLCDFLGRE